MFILQYYANLLLSGSIFYKGTKKPVIVNGCSIKGFALELAVKDFFNLPLEISGQRQIDVIATINGQRRHLEVKSNSSPICNGLIHSSIMVYAFGIDLNKPLNQQYGYIINKADFMAIGTALNHFKIGTVNGGKATTVKTQTVWNNSKNAPHGTKAYKLEDEYIKHGGLSFEEFFVE